jgi:glycogen(starch) synthase
VRILVLSDRYPPYYEGAYELNCQQVTDGLRARGHSLTVLTTTFGLKHKRVDEHIHRVLRFHNFGYRNKLHRRIQHARLFFQSRANYRLVQRLAEQSQPDVVFVWHMLATTILPILAVQDMGLPTVHRVGSHWLNHLRREYVDDPIRFKRGYRSALIGFRQFDELRLDTAIFVAQALKDSYQHAGFDLAQAVVIPTGIPAEWIAAQPPHRSPDGALRLLTVGRVEAQKGPDVAVQAVERLVRANYHVRLDMIGPGQTEYVAAVKQMITARGLDTHVRLVGFLPRQELLQRYADYDALLFPTLRWEGLPTTIIEAMANGLAVIASDIGGPKDIIRHDQNGLLVPSGDPAALADAVERLAVTPGRIAEIGAAAIRTIREGFTFERMLDQYETYLKAHCSTRENQR